MRIMGVDPGTQKVGCALVVYDEERGRFTDWEGRLLSAPATQRRSMRLLNIYQQLDHAIKETKPDVVAMETPFVGRNPQTALAMGQAQGVVMMAAEANLVRIAYFPPAQVKAQLAGHGNASKEAVAMVVRNLLSIPKDQDLSLDVTDALAVAVAFANSRDRAAILERK